MNSIVKKDSNYITFCISAVYVISLFYSKSGLSLSMLAFLGSGIWFQKDSLKESFKSFGRNKAYIGLVLVFGVYLFSGINSGDMDQWLKQVRIKLPFLLLPLSFFLLGPLETKWFKKLHIWLGIVGLFSAIPVAIHFFSNQAELIADIGKGKYMPTPIDHIHYSIILSYAALLLILLLVDNGIRKTKYEKCLMVSISSTLALFLHLLAVRSGLAIFYLGLMFIAMWYVYTTRRYIVGVLGLLFIIIAPVVMYQTVPSLQKKIGYMMYDYQQYKKGEGKNYSDSERLMSYGIAIDLWKKAPIVGHGVGDLKDLMIQNHKERYGKKEKYIFPHNQYLYVLASVGIIGFLFFFLGLLSPILYVKPDPYLWLIYIAMLASFMVENTVQRAVSIAFFLLFILWSIGRRRSSEITATNS